MSSFSASTAAVWPGFAEVSGGLEATGCASMGFFNSATAEEATCACLAAAFACSTGFIL